MEFICIRSVFLWVSGAMRKELLAVFQYWRKVDPEFEQLVRDIVDIYDVNEKVKVNWWHESRPYFIMHLVHQKIYFTKHVSDCTKHLQFRKAKVLLTVLLQ